ncbi:polysaccharide biosynthesis tyrosine autokinase [Sphingobacterium oryzagri]|uniref:non-specific protein-tyrosine kinase n=1 Tax=Sphingobacterium oryzagri TaxID=3025669 RepID=A0ABY7WHB0_9SPHI|nr:tyrosine-protein kinase family protein [Sphingobacterium sp. KACC 22765]WDF68986.1 polysaccharide biosynthesis tyrosine autokinase [Sphingobacterium sp. KACC 22765]
MKSKNIDWEDEADLSTNPSSDTDFRRIIGIVLSNWYWFLLCGLIGLAFSFFKVRYSVPSYNIRAKLIVSDDKKGGDLSASPLGELSGIMGTKSSVENEVEVLKTSDLMREMVLAEQAFITYSYTGKFHKVPIMAPPYKLEILSSPDSISTTYDFKIIPGDKGRFKLESEGISKSVKHGEAFLIDGLGTFRLYQNASPTDAEGYYGVRVASVRSTISGLSKSFSVSVTNKNVSTIDLTLVHQLPKQGERLLKSLIEKYVERNLHDKNVVADSTLSFINERLSKITDELAGVEDRISGYKQNTQLADIGEQSRILLENSANYTKSIAEAETQLSALDAITSYLSDTRNPRVVPSSILAQDGTFAALTSKYNELVLQRERLLLANTEDNPLVQNVTNQIAGLRDDMIANVGSTRRQLELAKQNQVQLSNRVTSQIQRVPTIERGYIDLARLQQIKQAQYIFLQEKWEETAIGRTANVSNSKIIDSPKGDVLPFEPKRRMTYALGLVLGLAIPALLLWLKDLLNVRIQSIDDIERNSSLPILGMIAHSEEHDQVVVSKTSRSPIAEQFRAMRTNLEFALNGGKILLFTSSMSGEGKSYVALNLAVTLALLDKKVLIMELDLRKPSITSKLGLLAGSGFSHYVVRQDMRLEEIIMPSGAHENVDLIQAGAIPPNPAELLVHHRTQELVRELSKRYDYILMDAPPVGMVTDAQLLSRYADSCLYLVRQGFTYKEQLRIPNELVLSNKIKPIHLIVNDVQKKGGYYSGYGYGYGYGYGDYGQEEKRRKRWQFWKK